MSEEERTQTNSKSRLQVLKEQIDAEQAIQTKLAQAAADKAAAEALRAKMELEAKQKAEHEERQRRVEEAQKNMREAAEKKAAIAMEEQAQVRELERQAEIQQEKIRETARERAAEQGLQEKLFLIEQENARLARELAQASTPRPEEPKPITLQSPEHPLSRIFGVRPETEEEIPQGIDAVTQSKNQAFLDKAVEGAEQMKTSPTEPLQAEPHCTSVDKSECILSDLASPSPETDESTNPWKARRKTRPFVDQATSAELEKLLRRELKINPNVQRCDQISAVYEYADVMRAAELTIESAKQRPQGHDQILGFLQGILEGSANV